ncbi:hypothetical protein DAPPUDRAFT_330383 [Daphnia pulex]|uniref:Uncharacterized protein n=1 Tax=Daphnia pulex TaxID=6669 RepID=E9HJF2_DAPPU|nr:hypothetical protein DAPPUDRAFT_330383 [Daphnia pulex]|eukprot:EFX68073.1 hypothetical protein DAPPUDRAFT_330383 [Daphnia pulex]
MAASVPAGRIKQDSDMETIRYLLEDGQDISAMTWGEDETNALHVAAANECNDAGSHRHHSRNWENSEGYLFITQLKDPTLLQSIMLVV